MEKITVRPADEFPLQMQFPLDMLRYDSCYPADQDSVAHIGYTFDGIRLESHEEINLIATHGHTPERWESFGWKVIRVERR